jgi:preprotein translocase subunit SecG
MSTFVIIIHIVVAIALILIVLLQTGKGADMGAAFGGGGGQTLFGSTGASTFLSRLTTIAAIVFMLTSLGLAYLSGHRSSRSVMTDLAPPETEQTGQAVPELPLQADQVPAGVPVEAEQVPSEAPIPPVAKETDVVTKTPPPTGESKPAEESGGEQF